ncbi:TetR family transcriptional regulator [Reinekea sp.]|jgi:AcrR family transcriptional regulator|uniref:TetR family transcriptional regulator n=1 Tax=Reinekea sp. TaxID=1970455 RepID=UPI003988F581
MCVIKQRAKSPEQKARRYQQILLAAENRFSVGEFESVNMNDIAADVGISKAALYRYFRTKESLFLALFVRNLEALIETSQLESKQQSLASAISSALIKSPVYCMLSAILHTILERNLTVDEAKTFKLTLLNLMTKFAKVIQQHDIELGLTEANAIKLLMQIQPTLIGVWHMTNSTGAVAEVIEMPELAMFKQDFSLSLNEHISLLVRNTLTSSQD